MPPIEPDAAYQGCLPSCKLHSTVGRTGASDLKIAHILGLWGTCMHVYACALERLHKITCIQ